jgi:hypothetical protein
MTDPVADRNDDDECQVLVAMLDATLDEHQQQLERIEHDDPIGYVWFGDRDAWLDKRLKP